jgi:hypothetical protein
LKAIRLIVVLGLSGASTLLADGGALLFQNQAGTLMISVFASPTPVTPGPVDLSVMVQNVSNHSIVEDARVMLKLQRGGTRIETAAAREQASNKLLYAAHLNLLPDSEGDWRLTVQVSSPETAASAEGALHVSPRPPALVAYWPYFAVVPLAIVLFALNRWLKATRSSGLSTRPVRPDAERTKP